MKQKKTTQQNKAVSIPVFRIRGRQEPATYIEPELPMYKGNPLIEALPPILSEAEAIRALTCRPQYNSEDRLKRAELRLHLAQTPLRLFTPLPIHTALEQRFSRMIRGGYLSRNPIFQNDLADIKNRVQELGKACAGTPNLCSNAFGFAIIGISGGGKTTGTERVLQLYPQVIEHTKYMERDFNRIQLVWLKLECPNDGSVKGLCQNFFRAVDDVLCTNYHTNYAANRRTVDDLLPDVAKVAAIHCLGVLVIDEIQHLSAAKSGGPAKMLNFFVQLANTIGVPVVLIGTYKALGILSREFRQIRRSSGQGDLMWHPMQNDREWERFSKALWQYQYLPKFTPWSKDLADTLYSESYGITDLAVKIFIISQCELITKGTGSESLTPKLLQTVGQEHFKMAQPLLKALREGDMNGLFSFDDVLMRAGDYYAPDKIDVTGPATSRSSTPPNVTPLSDTDTRRNLSDLEKPDPDNEIRTSHKPAKSSSIPKPSSEDSMMRVIAKGKEMGVSPYEALRSANLVANPDEYLIDKPVV